MVINTNEKRYNWPKKVEDKNIYGKDGGESPPLSLIFRHTFLNFLHEVYPTFHRKNIVDFPVTSERQPDVQLTILDFRGLPFISWRQ